MEVKEETMRRKGSEVEERGREDEERKRERTEKKKDREAQSRIVDGERLRRGRPARDWLGVDA